MPPRSTVPLGRALDLVQPLLAALDGQPDVLWAAPAGGLRRGVDLLDDLTLVVACDAPASVAERVASTHAEHEGVRSGYRRADIRIVVNRTPVDVVCVAPELAAVTLLRLTGSPAHVERLEARASTRGVVLDNTGSAEEAIRGPVAAETAVYRALGLPFIPPELRDDAHAVDAAAADALPALVHLDAIRGDLHCHTHYSDGRDSVDAMARAAVSLGYDYLAITDHSPSSAAVRNLSADTLARQADEIAAVREALPQLTIFHGCEVDILEDGSLDFPDRLLERLDLVLASLHDSCGHAPDVLMQRYTRAMAHPLVTLITHPMNRLVPYDPGYALDYDRLFDEAARTGTWLEIDGAPSHLDLPSALARKAVAAGVTLSIDSDCHRAEQLGPQMHMGVLLARRGWVEARHVANTRTVDVLRQALRAKRDGRVPFGSAC